MTNDHSMSGEQRHAARRARFWRTIFISLAISAVLGFLVGLSSGLSGEQLLAIPIVAVTGVILAVVGLVATSIWFFRVVDELETADNLWASLYGLYFYIAALPAWWALEKAGVAPAIDHWAIYVATVAVAVIVYGWRKFANH